jgi:hypothetical protein
LANSLFPAPTGSFLPNFTNGVFKTIYDCRLPGKIFKPGVNLIHSICYRSLMTVSLSNRREDT